MDFNVITNAIIYVVIPVWGVIAVFISKWMFKAKPGKNIIDKYPRKILFLAQLPFGKGWMKGLYKKDVGILQTYQHRIRIAFLWAMIPIFFIPLALTLYIYIDWFVLRFLR